MRWSGVGFRYSKIALDAYTTYLPLVAELAEMEKRCADQEGGVHADQRYYDLEPEVMRCGIETVVFSAMYLESAMYDFAADQLGDSYVDKHIDKLDLPSKIVIVPRLVTGREIDKSGIAFSAVSTLVGARNALVHTKSSRAAVEDLAALERQEQAVEKRDRKFHDDTHTAIKAVIMMSFEMARLVRPHWPYITDLTIEPNCIGLKEPKQVHALAVRLRSQYDKSIASRK
jgi:hypothetical protein